MLEGRSGGSRTLRAGDATTARALTSKAHRTGLQARAVPFSLPVSVTGHQKSPISLGTTTDFASRPSSTHFVKTDPHTGEVQDGFVHRFRRWEMQAAARRLLPGHRIGVCLRHQRRDPERDGVPVYRRARDHHTYFGGLMTCGNVWACPVCAAKVSERRRVDLRAGIDRHIASGGSVALLTLTVRHHAHQDAFGLVDSLLHLYRRAWSGRKTLACSLEGYTGQVRALEVTHGANGWHPHVHVLLFFNGPVDLHQARTTIFDRWSSLVAGAGLGPITFENGVTLQDGTEASAYASKWGVTEEITKANVKQGRRGGRTPFALLADYAQGDRQAGALFAEFVVAFKGKAQIHWSKGLRDRLGLVRDRTDEELAAATDARDNLAARITDDDWSKVVARHNLQPLVLEVLRDGDEHQLELLLARYRCTPRSSRHRTRRGSLGS